ncbi:MAG: GDSL-type esterase/lipase family protein [Treponema sp.]|jgi:acyl-CoA thioesterase-1|nr:GDSL-type esterase/lipase family protein [Treponema sp.]
MRHLTVSSCVLLLSLLWSCGKPPVIVCFGDSLTAGEGAERSEAWPALIQQRVKARVINAGRNGDNTLDALNRIEEVLSQKPDAVIVEFGANDVLQTFHEMRPPDPERMRENLAAIVEKLKSGSKVFLVRFYSPQMAADFSGGNGELLAALDGLFDSLGTEYGVEIIGGIWDGVWGNPSLMSDAIHPNAAGYRIMADNYFNALAPYLKEQGLLR